MESKELLAAMNKAYKYLALRDHFEAEIRKKLKNKDFKDDIIDETIKSLYSNKFLDDSKLAYKFASEKLKTEGKNKVLYRLLNKGVDRSVALSAIEDCYVDENEVCLEQLEKKAEAMGVFESLQKGQKIEGRLERKLVNYLKNKGFGMSSIIYSMKNIRCHQYLN